MEIRLFGGLRVLVGGAPLTAFMSAKAPALLAYLAVTGRAQRRDDLAGLLWGEMPDADARNNLRQVLTNLRRALDPYLIISREEVALIPAAGGRAGPASTPREAAAAGCIVDVIAFEAQLHPDPALPAAARAAQLEAAAACYTGDFLAGFFVRDAPAFEEWMLAQRARYRELALHALHTLAQLRLDLGDYDQAIHNATRLLALDEWREESHGQLMLALARTGQRSAALAQYQRCRRLLRQEFDVEPAAETTALYERIRAAMSRPRHNLPATTTGFVGREQEITQLYGLLAAPENRLLTILGPGGAGKTRLALEAARTCEPMFLNGVWFVALAGPQAGQNAAEGLAEAVAAALGCPLPGPGDPCVQVSAYLRPRELLLVLDNLEEWQDAGAWLCELLAQVPAIKVLATSRQRLNLQAERVFPLAGLPIPPDEAAATEAFAAAALFIRRGRRVEADFNPAPADGPAIARICRAVQGLPLGIELAAAWAQQLTPAEIAAEIERSLDILATARQDVATRQRSLRAVFDWSWGRLTPEEQAIFMRLAVFRGPFTRAAAEQVAGAAPAMLAALADRSLLWRRAGAYQLHEVTRRYAAEKLAAAGAAEVAQARHAAYYAGLLAQRQPRLKGRDQQACQAEIEAEVEEFRAAWQWMVAQADIAGLTAAAGGLYHFYLLGSRFREGQAAFRAGRLALEGAAAGTSTEAPAQAARLEHGRMMAREARFCSALAQYGDAQRLLQASIEALAHLGAADDVAFALGHLGGTARLQGDLDRAERCLQECLALRQQTGDQWGQAVALLELAGVAFMREDYEAARQRCEEGLAVVEDHGDLQTAAHLLTGLSLCHRELGRYGPAEAYVRRSLEVYEELGDRYGILQACLTLGELNRQLGDMAAARQFCLRAVQVAREIGDRSGEADGHYRLGQIAAGLGERDEALRQLHAALVQAHEIHETLTTLDILLELACLRGEMGDAACARELLHDLLAQPQLPDQRRARARAALGRLPGGAGPINANGEAPPLERLIARAEAACTAAALRP